MIVWILFATTVEAPAFAPPAGLFAEVPGAFEPQPCGGSGCYTNYLRVTDLDGDGDLDVVLPNSGSGDEPLVIWSNDGSGAFANTSLTTIAGGFAGHLRQIAIGDIDGDGDLDLAAPDATGDPDHLFVNDGAGVLVDETLARLAPGQSSNAAATRFGDVDNDGDLDWLVGDRFGGGGPRAAHLYLNDGTGVFTDGTNQLPSTDTGDVAYDFDLFDMDGDFDLDLLLDMHSGTSMLWENDGAGTFSSAAFPAQGALKYGPVACDVDADGDLDLWFDNAGPGYSEQLLINDGSGTFTDRTAARVSGNDGSDDNGVVCVDVDGDGDFDAAIASLSGEERILVNDGTGRFALLPAAFSPAGDSTLWMEFGDVDGDGRLDVATGQGESGNFDDRLYLGTPTVPVDARPPVFRAIEPTSPEVALGASLVVRFAVSDNATTDEGPRLQRAYAAVAGGEVPATFAGGDLYRVALPTDEAGAISWRLCAVDRAGNEACSADAAYTVRAGDPTTPTHTGEEPTVPGGDTADTGAPPAEGCGCTDTPAGATLGGLVWIVILAGRRLRC